MSEMKVANSIYEKIENKGIADAEKIYEAGVEKAKLLEAGMLTETQTKIKETLKKLTERCEDKIKTKTTEFEQEAKQSSLLKKKAIINQVFAEVHQRLNKQSDDDLTRLVVKMLKSEQINGSEIIKVAKKDYDRYARMFSTGKKAGNALVLDKLAGFLNNSRSELRLSGEYADIDGGFIIIGENYDIDHSYNTMLEDLKEKLEAEIADMLFEGQ